MSFQGPTLLVITPLSPDNSGMMLPPYSARGLTQSLEPIIGSSGGGNAEGTLVRETINGEAISLAPTQFRKWRSTITCRDVDTPCLDEAYIGQTVMVQCVVELSYLTGGQPQRPEVSGSSRVDGHFTYYRPELQMIVTGVRNSKEEYLADCSWQVDLREVKIPTLSP